MKRTTVSRRSYKDLRMNELLTYAAGVVQNCNGNTTFSVLEAEVADLQTKTAIYGRALVDACSGAHVSICLKNMAQADLLDALDTFADALQSFTKEESLVVEAGMQINPPKRRRIAELPPPSALQVAPTGRPGEVKVMVSRPKLRQIQAVAIEYSADGGITWITGVYQSRSRFVLKGLPSMVRVQFRACCVGSGGRLSVWSTTVSQVVL
jgi:hypothetical protein